MPKVLIVDDEPHIRLLLEQTLEEFEEKGVEIITASNGKQALELIKKETPDIVYLDVMMPEINGYDVCNAVKNDPALKGVYIILLTAKGQEYDKKMGDDSGADIYMTKPFNPDVIIAKTASILNITL